MALVPSLTKRVILSLAPTSWLMLILLSSTQQGITYKEFVILNFILILIQLIQFILILVKIPIKPKSSLIKEIIIVMLFPPYQLYYIWRSL